MSAEVELISTMGEKKSWNRPPIQMEFQVTPTPPFEDPL
jgi:AP-2 complex subunit mu-1